MHSDWISILWPASIMTNSAIPTAVRELHYSECSTSLSPIQSNWWDLSLHECMGVTYVHVHTLSRTACYPGSWVTRLQLRYLLFSCTEGVSHTLSKLILTVLKGIDTLTNLPLRARSSETEQGMVKYYVCMRFQSKATIYGEIYALFPGPYPNFQLLQIPILQQRVEWEWGLGTRPTHTILVAYK